MFSRNFRCTVLACCWLWIASFARGATPVAGSPVAKGSVPSQVARELFSKPTTETGKDETETRLLFETPVPRVAASPTQAVLRIAQARPRARKKNEEPLEIYSGRNPDTRVRLVDEEGGNEASEDAVELGLKWLAAHQAPDGGWHFNHGIIPTHQGQVNDPGKVKSRTGATGLALMAFLGAGYTHKDGEYKATVQKGLNFLVRSGKALPGKGSDYNGEAGSMYCHGIAAIALAEAYGMTQDRVLKSPAEQAIQYIVYAQDKKGGGWRYKPQQPGDTSVTGWQVTALKAGHEAYLAVPKNTIAGAINFLDLVQQEGSFGAFYGYTDPGKRPSTSAIGLLCRMYLGRKKTEAGTVAGVKYLAELGPSKTNAYHNYYASQVLFHYGGEEWKKWNAVMRDHLVKTQVAKGEVRGDQGSWKPQGGHVSSGGRLCETSLNVMILEAYYRHKRIYSEPEK